MISEFVDRCVAVVSPIRALARMQARATIQQIAAFSNSNGGYNAGKLNRLTKHWSRQPMREIEVPRAQIDQLRAESWNLYRNNPYARKIVRTLETKVVGRGMHPHSLAKREDGKPHEEFRRKAADLWWSMSDCIDVRGRPGRGGCDLVELQKLALRACILSGNAFSRTVIVSSSVARNNGAPVRLQLQAIDSSRLSPESKADGLNDGNQFYRGVELDQNGRRVAYHFTTPPLGEMQVDDGKASRISAENIVHLYAQEDIDQILGVPWFAAALLQFRDTGDLQYNVLKASAMAACVVAMYKLGRGQTKLGLNGQSSDDLTDDDGNRITRLQPGMFINGGPDGDIKGFAPPQPTTNVEAFIQHMLRGTGASLPGVKASTVTGDYRGSSFSSERSADNDCWPEMESVQDWFATGWCQPIYEEVIRLGVVSGYFAGIVTPEEFVAREREFLSATWSGPVPRSINPTDDAKAAQLRIALGMSSPQLECEAIGRDPMDVLSDVEGWIAACEARGLPDWFIAMSLGQTKPPQEGAPANAEQTSNPA